jgi:hypothetical protein
MQVEQEKLEGVQERPLSSQQSRLPIPPEMAVEGQIRAMAGRRWRG